MKAVFEFEDYKDFLLSVERQRASVQKGFRSKLANAAGCQSAYVSHVLNGAAHFSLEQGIALAVFLELSELERKFFLTLIELARAGSEELRAYFRKQLEPLRESHLNLKSRVRDVQAVPPEAQAKFYSHWMYGAMHLMPALREFRDVQAMARALRIPQDAVRDAVLFLISCGLIEEKNGQLRPGPTQLHLAKDSPYIRQHHTNWRLSAIESLLHMERSDIHYSTISTLSHADAEKIKLRCVEVIEDYVKTVRESPEQTMFGFNLDFYSMIK
jgi:uncharacterized protein (TIGR02147 family)